MASSQHHDPESLLPFDDTPKGCTASFEEHVRQGFIRKGYGLLAAQLAVTTVISALGVLMPGVAWWLRSSGVSFLSSIFSFVFLIALRCFQSKYPYNLQLLFAFTVCESVTVACIVSQFAADVVVQALVLTTSVVGALTAYTFRSGKDFGFLGGYLFSGLISLMCWGFLGAVFGFGMGLLYSLAGAILFSAYIVYDTSRLLHTYTPDEYIEATIQLYLDIINLFIYILRILNDNKRSSSSRSIEL